MLSSSDFADMLAELQVQYDDATREQAWRRLGGGPAGASLLKPSAVFVRLGQDYSCRGWLVKGIPGSAYILMACLVMAYMVIAYIVMDYIVMDYKVMADIVMAYTVMAYCYGLYM